MGLFDFIANLFVDSELKIPHIHQRGTKEPYTFIMTDQEYTEEELNLHPAILTYPDLFEVVNAEIPEKSQGLNFQIPEPDLVQEMQSKLDALTVEIENLKNK